MSVRFAQTEDFPVINKITEGVLNQINITLFNWPSELLLSELRNTYTLVYEHEGCTVSFLCYRESDELLEISVLATAVEAQSKGFQTKLIEYLQLDAAKRKKSILLEVHAANEPARALYQRKGFNQIHIRKSYYRDGGDALVLQWQSQ